MDRADKGHCRLLVMFHEMSLRDRGTYHNLGDMERGTRNMQFELMALNATKGRGSHLAYETDSLPSFEAQGTGWKLSRYQARSRGEREGEREGDREGLSEIGTKKDG